MHFIQTYRNTKRSDEERHEIIQISRISCDRFEIKKSIREKAKP